MVLIPAWGGVGTLPATPSRNTRTGNATDRLKQPWGVARPYWPRSHAAQIPIWKPPSRDLDRDPKGSETAARRPLRGGRGGGRGPLEYPAIGEGDGSTAIVSSASRRERF